MRPTKILQSPISSGPSGSSSGDPVRQFLEVRYGVTKPHPKLRVVAPGLLAFERYLLASRRAVG